MQIKRLIAASASIAAVALVAGLYTTHAAKSSDHQDTYNLANRTNTSADITDVFVFPAPDNSNNVVFAMDVSPLLTPAGSALATQSGSASTAALDPTLIYQFKISHQSSGVEDQVIQVSPSGVGNTQSVTLYGPVKPNEVGTVNTIAGQPTGTTTFNTSGNFQNNTVQFFVGPRTDPFNFDLFSFFTFLGDRNYGTHSSQTDPGPEAAGPLSNGDSAANVAPLTPAYDKSQPATTPSFNGFASGTTSNGSNANSPLGNYACSTNPASDTLFAGPFDVLSIVVEVPKSLISNAGGSTIHVWATTNSSTGS